MLRLHPPSLDRLPAFVAALERGWSPDTILTAQAAREALESIRRDPERYIALQTDREAQGGPVTLPDGSQVPRLPGYRLWIWDDQGFCGAVSFRWQKGTAALPPYVLGHMGYSVVPWRRREGIATRALGLMRERVRAEGLDYVDLTTDLDNVASQKVITANGGFPLERFRKPQPYGGAESLRFRWYTGLPLPMEPQTPRVRLRQWREEDKVPFAQLNADPRVMEHFPATGTREESDAMVDRMRASIALRGFGPWAAERRDTGEFLGFIGLFNVRPEMHFAPAIEVGWRFHVGAWGHGFATEGARECLRLGFARLGLKEILAYTAHSNARSMAVMRRLGMVHAFDFEHPVIPEGHRVRPHKVFKIEAQSFASADTRTNADGR